MITRDFIKKTITVRDGDREIEWDVFISDPRRCPEDHFIITNYDVIYHYDNFNEFRQDLMSLTGIFKF